VGAYLVAFAVIFGINLLPAFGPPTWAVLVFFKLNRDLAAVPLVLGGALAAASGRFVLAMAAATCAAGSPGSASRASRPPRRR
jgi:hypothetical protein